MALFPEQRTNVTFRRPSAVQPLETRRADVERNREMEGRLFVSSFEQPFQNSGEIVFDVVFPVLYTQKPIHGFSLELAPNEAIEPSNAPQSTGCVKTWTTRLGEDGSTQYYEGATVVGVCLGHADMKGIFTAWFEGIALRNPLRDPGNAESVQ